MARKTFAKPLKTARQTQNAPRNTTAARDRAVAALLESRTIVAAAQKAEIGESTLRRWLREDEDFQQQIRRHRQEALGHVALRPSSAPPKPSKFYSTAWRQKNESSPAAPRC